MRHRTEALAPSVSIVIPTYRREGVLIASVEMLLSLADPADEILLVDQTEQHEPKTTECLERWSAQGNIRWIRQQPPSIAAAMNRGLSEAKSECVLFLDDDIVPDAALVSAHRKAHAIRCDSLIAGRVIQPWEEGIDFAEETSFRFAGLRAGFIQEFMGGNFSVRRTQALALGGFDENFVRVAYRFEAEFAHRFLAAGNEIWFEPDACLHHLRVVSGGTRSFGLHLTTTRPDHAVGAYYYVLRTRVGAPRIRDFAKRMIRSVATRHHLRRPWWIPLTLLAELRGMIWAFHLNSAGPKLMESSFDDA